VFIAATLFGGTGVIYPSCGDSVLSKGCTGNEWGKALLIFPQHVNGIEGFVEWTWGRAESKTIQLGIKIDTQTGSVEGLLCRTLGCHYWLHAVCQTKFLAPFRS
jgi:hypothetical protein